MTVFTWVGVAILGGVGALARFVVDRRIASVADADFPLGTFVINVSGSALLGLLTGLAVTGSALILAGTATIGSYTTFSTWMLETQRLREDGEFWTAVLNVILSIAAGLAAVALGRAIGHT
jgi:CrcB protein